MNPDKTKRTWNNEALPELDRSPGSDREAVEASALRLNPDTAQSRQP